MRRPGQCSHPFLENSTILVTPSIPINCSVNKQYGQCHTLHSAHFQAPSLPLGIYSSVFRKTDFVVSLLAIACTVSLSKQEVHMLIDRPLYISAKCPCLTDIHRPALRLGWTSHDTTPHQRESHPGRAQGYISLLGKTHYQDAPPVSWFSCCVVHF